MDRTLTPADSAHCHLRPAELRTLRVSRKRWTAAADSQEAHRHMRRITMNTKLVTITRRGLAAGLLAGALALGGASAASASVPRPCPGGNCGGHIG